MNSRHPIIGILLSAFVLTLEVKPQTTLALPEAHRHHTRYRLVEIGTFGGPNSVSNVLSRMGRNDGTFVGAANTPDLDLFAPDHCFDGTCLVQHAWKGSQGKLTDLGVLRQGYSSYTNAINSRGLIVGQSQNGDFDPLTGAPVVYLATIWDHGKIKNLGTLGGGNSIAIAAADDGFVMGAAENGIVEASGFAQGFPFDGVSQIRAFGWSGGKIFDLGTLGGTSAFPGDMNNRGEVVGVASTSPLAEPDGSVPTHPFLWARGRMHDLGTLGGNFAGAGAINNRGQVAGGSSLQGDQITHAFLWQHGKMTDLGTLGGTYAEGDWLNDFGNVIGMSFIAGDENFHAFVWQDGTMIDLATVGRDNFSWAHDINIKGQVVGQSWLFDGHDTTASHAFLWERGGSMLDLNTLVTNPSEIYLTEATFITDRGWIVANGPLPNGDVHTAILIPEEDVTEIPANLNANDSAPISSLPEKSGNLSPEALKQVQKRLAERLQRGHGPRWNRIPALRKMQ